MTALGRPVNHWRPSSQARNTPRPTASSLAAIPAVPHATRLLITADAGGNNGYRLRLWKLELQKLADETGLENRGCHFPPGTSKGTRLNIACSRQSPRTGAASHW